MRKSILFIIIFILAYLVMGLFSAFGVRIHWVETATLSDKVREYFKILIMQEFDFKLCASLVISVIAIVVKGLLGRIKIES